jgi:tetratricopeptide (TPR) repeat protein
VRIHRLAAIVLLLALQCVPVAASEALEAEVQEIERLAVTAHWSESDRKIEGLVPRAGGFSEEQRQRVEFIRLRNLGLAGKEAAALEGLAELLEHDLPPELRLRAYTTAISIAANVEDWTRAFTWLSDGLAYLPQAPDRGSGLLGVASYLHSLVGETAKARDFALRALELVEAGDDARAVCLAVGDVALAEDHAGNFQEAEAWRHRQIDSCTRAGDLVFIANGKYGVSKMASKLGRHAEALAWARRALADFETSGYAAGSWSVRMVLAKSLIESNRGLGEAEQLLKDTLAYYYRQGGDLAIAETETLLASLAERHGDSAAALAHLKRAL